MKSLSRSLLLLSFLIALVTCFALPSSASPPYKAWGKVVIPNGDPVVGVTVVFYVGEQRVGVTDTNDQGVWQFESWAYCDVYYPVTACLGSLSGRGERVTGIIACDGPPTQFPDIVLQCGGPRQPPCPTQ